MRKALWCVWRYQLPLFFGRAESDVRQPAIIAATALANHLTLITRNATDFDSIDGLTLVNPFMTTHWTKPSKWQRKPYPLY